MLLAFSAVRLWLKFFVLYIGRERDRYSERDTADSSLQLHMSTSNKKRNRYTQIAHIM
jgi:protein tyrosine phosphatase